MTLPLNSNEILLQSEYFTYPVDYPNHATKIKNDVLTIGSGYLYKKLQAGLL